MAQTPKKWGPEPWLKLNFVLHIFTCKKDDIVGADGLKTYINEEIPIQSSYISCEPSSGVYRFKSNYVF